MVVGDLGEAVPLTCPDPSAARSLLDSTTPSAAPIQFVEDSEVMSIDAS